MLDVFQHFKLKEKTMNILGHAMALYRDDDYLQQPAQPTIERIKMYCEALSRHGKSPFLYPLYGLGELPQAFARRSALFGGTYMLNTNITEIVYENGVAVGIRTGNDFAKAKLIVADPTYFPNKVKKTGQVIRSISILDHPIKGTGSAPSLQIIIPHHEAKRKSDIYISLVSSGLEVSPKGLFICIVQLTVETNNPSQELEPAYKLLGSRIETFERVYDIYDPIEDGTKDKVFISTSYDPTSHFESTCTDVLGLYKRITGKPLVLKS